MGYDVHLTKSQLAAVFHHFVKPQLFREGFAVSYRDDNIHDVTISRLGVKKGVFTLGHIEIGNPTIDYRQVKKNEKVDAIFSNCPFIRKKYQL